MKARGFLAALALTACTGTITGPPGGAGGGSATVGDGGQPCAESRNDAIRLGLEKACAGCHTNSSRPFFGSLEAFENGLVWNPAYVKPGDPDNSLLVKLLEGRGTGTYKQMPTNTTYAEAVTAGKASLSIEQLKQWIRELPPTPPGAVGPSPDAFTVRRLSAEEMVTSLMDQLGLTIEDFIDTGRATWRDEPYTFRGGRLAVWPVDIAPGISGQYVSDARAGERFLALGGPNTLQLRARDVTLAPSAMQTLVQVSQAWCALAIDKAGNKAVLSTVTLADKSATKSTELKANVRALHLRMLGEPATDADVEALYGLYVKHEAATTKAGWVAVCAALVRHPQWLTF